MQKKFIDFLVVIILLILGTFYALYISQNSFLGKSVVCGIVYLIPSTIYLGLRKKKDWVKIITASLLFGTLFGFFFEFIAEYNQSYSVISTLTPFKILGVLPIDNIIGHTMMVLLTLVFYEHFIDKKTGHKISHHIVYALIPAIVVISGIILLFDFHLLPKVPYIYFVMGSIAILFPIYLGIIKPQFIKNMAMIAVFFFFVYLMFEVVAVHNSWWIYPNTQYIGWVEFLGSRFPIEELLFWMFFYAATLVSFYELYIDIHPKITQLHK